MLLHFMSQMTLGLKGAPQGSLCAMHSSMSTRWVWESSAHFQPASSLQTLLLLQWLCSGHL